MLATYAGSANYTTAFGVDEFSVGKATPAVSVADPGGTYNSTSVFPATAATVTGVGSDGTIASFGSSSLSYAYYSGSYATVAALDAANPPALAGPPSNAGSYTVLATYVGSASYATASGLDEFSIGKATPAVSVTDPGGTYNATSVFAATAATVTGVGSDGTIASFGSSSLSYAYYSGSYATVAALNAANPPALAGPPSSAGSYTVLATYAGSANYATASGVDDFSIGKATPTVSVADAGGTYSTSAFPATAATVTGVGSDGTIASFGSSSLSYAYYSGTYSTVAALTAANPPALGGAPSAAGGYTVLATYAGGTNYVTASGVDDFSIGKATPAVSVTDAGGTYNGTSAFPATAATVTGVGSDGTIASFGSSSLSYAYYSGTYATVTALTAANPPALGGAVKHGELHGAGDVCRQHELHDGQWCGRFLDRQGHADGKRDGRGRRLQRHVRLPGNGGHGHRRGQRWHDRQLRQQQPVVCLLRGNVQHRGGPHRGQSAGLGCVPVGAGSYTVLATYAGSASYTTAGGVDDFSIGKATPTVSVTDAGGTYNGTSVFAATAATVTGVGSDGTIASFGSSSLSYAYYAGTYSTVAALTAANPPALGGAPSGAGSYTVLATYSGSANYTTASGVDEFSIGKATPTVSVTDAGGTYNGTSAFPATAATVTGVGSDGTIASFGSSSLSYAYYSGTYASVAALTAANPPALGGAPSAAGSYTVLATYAGSANYTTAGGVDDFSIGKATPTVSVTDAGGTYNGTSVFPATAATVTGVGSDGTIASFGSSSLSYAYYTGTYSTVAALNAANPSALGGAPSSAGSYTVLATYAGSANYTTAGGVDNFSIGKATPTVSVTDAGGTYNGTSAFPATAATVTGVGSDGTIASFGSSSLSYAYYSGTYSTVAALAAANPPALGSARQARGATRCWPPMPAARITRRAAEWTISRLARPRRQ